MLPHANQVHEGLPMQMRSSVTLLVLVYLMREPLSLASTSGGSLVPLWKTLCGGPSPYCWAQHGQPLNVGLWGSHLCHHLRQHLGQEGSSGLPTASSHTSYLLLLSISPGEGGSLSEGDPQWEYHSSWPTLGVTFILTIWNGVATSQDIMVAGIFEVACMVFSFGC